MTVSDKAISVEKLSEKTLMSNLKWVEQYKNPWSAGNSDVSKVTESKSKTSNGLCPFFLVSCSIFF